MTNHRPSPSTEVGKPRVFYGYTIVLASFAIFMITWGAQYSFGVFFMPVLAEFNWTRAATSGAYSLNAALTGFLGIICGRLSDRFGPRVVITVCGLLMGLSYLLMSHISAIWQIYLFYGVLLSIGMAGIWVPILSTVARWFIKRRGLASGIVASGVGIGILIVPPLANQLISTYSWRTSYLIIGTVVLLVIVIIAQLFKRDPSQMGLLAYGANSVSADSPNLEVPGFSLPEAIRDRQFWIISVVFVCGNFCLQTVMVHIVPHATGIGISAAAAATVLSFVGVVSIGSKIGAGSLVDMIGNKRTMIIVFVLMSLSFLWLRLSNELWMLYLFMFVFGLAYGGCATLESPIVAEYFGLRAHGAIFGVAMFIMGIGGAIGPLVTGFIFDISGSYYWAFTLCAILGITGLILTISLKFARQAEGNKSLD